MEKSIGKFAKYFKKLLDEDMTAGDAGVGSTGGFSPDNISSSDFYAPGDSRTPFPIFGKGKVLKRKLKKKKKAKKVYLPGEDAEEAMCPDACCGKPVSECKCGPDCPHCDCYEINNG